MTDHTDEDGNDIDLIQLISDLQVNSEGVVHAVRDLKKHDEALTGIARKMEGVSVVDTRDLKGSVQGIWDHGRKLETYLSGLQGIVSNTRKMKNERNMWSWATGFLVMVCLCAGFYMFGAFSFPGRPHFGSWGCKALGGQVAPAQKGRNAFCYYVLE